MLLTSPLDLTSGILRAIREVNSKGEEHRIGLAHALAIGKEKWPEVLGCGVMEKEMLKRGAKAIMWLEHLDLDWNV